MVDEARRYEVLAILGAGGFGTVYRARFVGEGGFCKEVALKVLNPNMEGVEEVASRLRDEARVLGLLRHRSIVQVDRLARLDGRWTVVMEYVEGQDLSRLLRAGPLPVGVALEITAEVAGALQAAYTRAGPNGQPLRLLHRDLKPSNVRITPFGDVKVLDFGVARAEFVEREARTRSLTFGTPEYMAPERLDLSGDSAAGDMYALGVILYEMLVGRHLGRTSANPTKHNQKMELVAETLGQVEIPERVIQLVCSMLAFDEATRPGAGSVEHEARALVRLLGDASLRSWADWAVSTLHPPGSVLPAQAHSLPSSILIEGSGGPAEDGKALSESHKALTPPGQRPGNPGEPLVAIVAEEATAWSPAIEVAPPRPPSRQTADAAASSSASSARWFSVAVWTILGIAASSGLVTAGAAAWWTLRPTPMVSPKAGSSGDTPRSSPPTPRSIETGRASTTQRRADFEPGTGSQGEAVSPEPAGGPVVPARPHPTPRVSPPEQDDSRTRRSAGSRRRSMEVPVRILGDAVSVTLLGAQGWIPLPGSVPADSYTILASFDGRAASSVGTLTVTEGQPLLVKCLSQFGKCEAVPEVP